ncbi:reverse transcriptase domain-containing protein [Tanacetum coccineum]
MDNVNIQDFCEEHYDDILPIIMDKVRRDKRKEVHARLDFKESSKKGRRAREGSQNSSAGVSPVRHHTPSRRPRVQDSLRYNDGNVFNRLSRRRRSVHERLNDTYSPSMTRSRPSRTSSRDPFRIRGRSLSRDRSRHRDRLRDIEESYDGIYSQGTRTKSESSTSDTGHWKSRDKRRKTLEEDLAVPWSCEDVDPFTPQIRNFRSSRKTRMPNNVKTYDGTGDPEDHLKVFQASAQVEHWAMPTWCHMFNSTLIGAARVWFDELPPESIDSYKDLKAAFLAYFMQQKKHAKDPVEIHNIKQRDGETIEEFMERFKVETGRMKGASECMKISGFMHGVNNPELTKCLNERVLKTLKEMMTTTTAFIRGETATASKKKVYTPWKPQDQSKRTPKEIFAPESEKFKPPPPMVTPADKRSSNKQDRDKQKNGKKEAPAKEKAVAIYMIQPWHRVTRQKVTLSFAHVNEITFPPLSANKGIEGPFVIEAEIGGHAIHRMYVDGGSSMEVLYEHCFNRLRPEIKSQMVPATTSLTGFSGETIWPLGQLRLLHYLDAKRCATITTTSKDFIKKIEGGQENLKVVIHPDFPDQEVSLGGMLSIEGRKALCMLLKRNLDIFAWQPSDMTGVPRQIAEHRLNIRDGYPQSDIKRGARLRNEPRPSKQRVVEGMFLGYMVGPEGIKPCPEKIEAVLQLPSPRTIKGVQSLNGKLAGQNRSGAGFQTTETAYTRTPHVGGTKAKGRANNVLVRLPRIGWRCLDDRKGLNPDASLFCESGFARALNKLYPNGKTSPSTGLRGQEATKVLPSPSYRSYHGPAH